MKSPQKFDLRLLREIEATVGRGREEARSLAAIGEEDRIPVTITLAEEAKVGAVEPGERSLESALAGDRPKKSPVAKFLAKIGADEVDELPLSNSLVVELTPRQIQQLDEERELLNDIEQVRLVKREEVTCLHHSVQVIEARPYVWEGLQHTGNGVKVAILDSGVDKNHPALAGKVVSEFDTSGEGVGVPGSHGTHVAGIVASQNGFRRGVAPDCDLINGKVLTSFGFGTHVDVEQGMQLAFQQGADVVNMSLGWSHIFHGWKCDDGFCSLCRAATALVKLGVVVVVAAGNEDNLAAQQNPAVDTSLRCPGQCRDVITVGAVDNAKELASFSSVGPASYVVDGWTVNIHFPFSLNVVLPRPAEPWWTKPDVCAPGVDVNSTVTGSGWAAFSGTSMASPHVAGIAALMLDKDPKLSPQTVKNLIKHTAESLKDTYTRDQVGDGVANAYTAVLHA